MRLWSLSKCCFICCFSGSIYSQWMHLRIYNDLLHQTTILLQRSHYLYFLCWPKVQTFITGHFIYPVTLLVFPWYIIMWSQLYPPGKSYNPHFMRKSILFNLCSSIKSAGIIHRWRFESSHRYLTQCSLHVHVLFQCMMVMMMNDSLWLYGWFAILIVVSLVAT